MTILLGSMLVLTLLGTPIGLSAQNCTDQNVTDQAELNVAIEIYNSECAIDDSMTITIAETILLLEETTPINNNSGAQLALRGGGTLDGSSTVQILSIAAAEMVIEDLSFINGLGGIDGGGAIFNDSNGTLSLENVQLSNNVSNFNLGGAIFNRGTIRQISNVTFADNSTDALGGAISNSGTIQRIVNTTFQNNFGGFSSGAINNSFNGLIIEIIQSTFSKNEAANSAGAIGNGGTILSISESSFLRNISGTNGGAITNSNDSRIRQIIKSVFIENTAERFGGAISNAGEIDLISNTTFIANQTPGSGGGVMNTAGSNFGGNIETISNSTFVDNTARAGGALGNLGGIEEITQSTFSANDALFGAAIFNEGIGGTAGLIESIQFVTIFNNGNGSDGTGIYNNASSQITIESSIVADNGGGDCISFGTFSALGANLDSDGTCTGFSLPSADPQLLPLADNGGLTETHALTADSPAIDVAESCPEETATDQRGAPRPAGESCDLGAYEFQPN